MGFGRIHQGGTQSLSVRADDPSALFDGVSCIGFEVVEGVALAAGPGDFHALSLSGFSQAKSQGEFALRAVARGGVDGLPAGAAARGDTDLRADAVAIRARVGSFPSHSGTDLRHGTRFLHRVSSQLSCPSQSPARGICGLHAGLGHYTVLPVAARSLTIPQRNPGEFRGVAASY